LALATRSGYFLWSGCVASSLGSVEDGQEQAIAPGGIYDKSKDRRLFFLVLQAGMSAVIGLPAFFEREKRLLVTALLRHLEKKLCCHHHRCVIILT